MRSELVQEWLATTKWANWKRTPLAGDASARRYERIFGPDDQSVILMDAPLKTCGRQFRFVEIAAHLSNLSLAAPEILAWNEPDGLMMLTDLGQADFATHLRASPDDETKLYASAVDVLKTLQTSPPPSGLTRMTPDIGTEMIDLAFEWAAKDHSRDLKADITTKIHALLAEVDPNPSALSLRDFHAENLIWRSKETGVNRVGLLDFQDAFITHPTYDLASLLRDARRDVSSDLLIPLISQLAGNKHDASKFKRAFHVMAIQRNLRILGIFNKLAKQDRKITYLDLIPRVWVHLQTDLADAGLSDLALLIERAFSPVEK
ncbi:Phosphotransferase enzyme family protein [Octadecabacter ascidiaceicola]|uniref:Phosphotransferase enzyme family protein n=2 Tax=Octadecabacter ascidiaceicola TaxID=1655543 RepID=A0A238KEB8_9RHOB|nr:Phosphotransferase enzyme family protein [Octadecabacter ascidiaceicola]